MNDTPEATTAESQPAPFQFGLRWLLIAITGLSLFLAAWIWSREWAIVGLSGAVFMAAWIQAVRTPRWYWTAATLGAAILLGFVALQLSSVASWYGYAHLPITIRVIDRATGAGIANAQVIVTASEGAVVPLSTYYADGQGVIQFQASCSVRGKRGLLIDTANAIPDLDFYIVFAPGYHERRVSFHDLLARPWDHRVETLEIVIALDPVP